ncbi:histone H1A, sperm-like [Episyrphus balteatus]|uniref:histone H1A, sperm-like n=1 Tax=Episyrphus balteatus TaxID=286459 RepID=UPI00248655BC|nr:histone H1A, sperm-like [Episyrphus balteatus]
MTRARPSESSPRFLSYEMFTGAIQTSVPYSSPIYNTQPSPEPKLNKEQKNTLKIKRPSYSEMIDEAIFEKHQRGKGASLVAIKKYLQETYSVDVKNIQNRKRICAYIRESIGNGGHLKKITGHGAQGSVALTDNARKKFRIRKEKLLGNNTEPDDKKKVAAGKTKRQLTDTPVTRMRVK